MELIQGIKERRSIRRFQEKPVPREVLREIVGTAAWAPSWKNTQTARYIVIDDREKILELAGKACMMGFRKNMETLSKAPVVVLLTGVTGRSGYERDGSFSTLKGSHWESFDAGIAAQTFCLAAWDKGVGTVIMGLFDEKEIAKAVQIPEGQQICAVIAAGYPLDVPDAPPRKAVDELITFREP